MGGLFTFTRARRSDVQPVQHATVRITGDEHLLARQRRQNNYARRRPARHTIRFEVGLLDGFVQTSRLRRCGSSIPSTTTSASNDSKAGTNARLSFFDMPPRHTLADVSQRDLRRLGFTRRCAGGCDWRGVGEMASRRAIENRSHKLLLCR